MRLFVKRESRDIMPPTIIIPKAPLILLVNPWITDFAAFDLWAKPMGLLLLASLLRDGGCGVALLDCLERHDPATRQHPDVVPGVDRKHGTGKFPKMEVPKPLVYAQMPRRYYRHGIHPDSFREKLQSMPRPDLIWVTCTMTYWYPGVQQTIEMVRRVHPGAPIWLGGIYARLCSRHAAMSCGADEIIDLPSAELPDKIAAATGFSMSNKHLWGDFARWPSPALDLLPRLTYAPIMASRGCPFNCPYCASRALQPRWERKTPLFIYDEIVKWHRRLGISDFAFYDDALLLDAEAALIPALERICKEGPKVRFHTPNAVHIRALGRGMCHLLQNSGFTTMRLGLETTKADKQRAWGGKTDTAMFVAAVNNLLNAGFPKTGIGVYLLCGLPGQSPEDVAEAVQVVRETGAQP